MLSLYRASRWGLTRRHLSQVPLRDPLGPKKPGKVEEGGWRGDLRKFGKYLAVLVPSLILTAVTTQVVNHKGTKDAIESVFPAYVDFVRKNVGFEEEDLGAIERARITVESIAGSVDVTVTLTSCDNERVKEVLHFEDVKGFTTCSALMDQVRARIVEGETPALYSRVDTKDVDSVLRNVDISLDFSDPPPLTENGDKGPYSPYSLLRRERQERLAALSAEEAAVSGTSRIYANSQWNRGDLPGIDVIVTTERDLVEAGKVRGGGAIRACGNTLHARFYNVVAYLDRGMQRYKSYISANSTSILSSWSSHHQARLIRAEQERKATASMTSSAKRSRSDKARALGRIKELEGRLERLKEEMRVGMRPIDDVEAEMRAVQTEMSHLKRSWVNRFYFF